MLPPKGHTSEYFPSESFCTIFFFAPPGSIASILSRTAISVRCFTFARFPTLRMYPCGSEENGQWLMTISLIHHNHTFFQCVWNIAVEEALGCAAGRIVSLLQPDEGFVSCCRLCGAATVQPVGVGSIASAPSNHNVPTGRPTGSYGRPHRDLAAQDLPLQFSTCQIEREGSALRWRQIFEFSVW